MVEHKRKKLKRSLIRDLELRGEFSPRVVYQIPETRENDLKYDPLDLWERVNGKITLWKFTGCNQSERALQIWLYLSANVGYHFAVLEEDFVASANSRGYQDALNMERVVVEEVPDLGKLVRISEKALECAKDTPK